MSVTDNPKAFVDWLGVTTTLQHAATGHVRTVMLLHKDGSLLAIGHGKSQTTGQQVNEMSKNQQITRLNDDTITSALIATIWHDHAEFGGGHPLTTLNIDFANGQIAITVIGDLLLCFVANHQIQPGMLRGKLMSIAHCLGELVDLYQ